MRTRLLRLHLLALCMLAPAACVADLPPRSCGRDDDCLQADVKGTCLANPKTSKLWCAFKSGRCPSDLEWGILAGEGLAGTCVDVGTPEGGGKLDAPISDAAMFDAGGPADAPPADAPPADADVTAPHTTITGKPSAISGSHVTFIFEANETATSECALDDSAFAPCTSPKEYLDLTALPNPHVFQVRARDLSGNIEEVPASYAWQVDPNSLDTTLTSTPAATSGPSVSFSFSATRPGTFECKLDPLESGFTVCTTTKTYSGLSDARNPYTIGVGLTLTPDAAIAQC